MATTGDVLALAKAGFSRDEIASILGSAPDPAPAPAPDPAPVPAPAPDPAPAPAPAASQPDLLAQLLSRVDSLTGALQANAVMTSKQPQPETADQILASIIRPPQKKE